MTVSINKANGRIRLCVFSLTIILIALFSLCPSSKRQTERFMKTQKNMDYLQRRLTLEIRSRSLQWDYPIKSVIYMFYCFDTAIIETVESRICDFATFVDFVKTVDPGDVLLLVHSANCPLCHFCCFVLPNWDSVAIIQWDLAVREFKFALSLFN